MRLVIMSTGAFAVPLLEWLHGRQEDTTLELVTRPAKSAGSSRRGPVNPAREAASRLGLPIQDPATANDGPFHEHLRALHVDLLVVCDYGEILSAETLKCARLGGINLHGSLLPAYRGAAPVAWALLDGQAKTGVSVIHMTPKLDAGPILARRELAIGPQENAAELEARLAVLGVPAVASALELLRHWDGSSPIGTPQDVQAATKAPRLKREDGQIDWRRSARQISDQVRALQPWPGSYSFVLRSQGAPLRIHIVAARPRTSTDNDSIPWNADIPPGEIRVGHDREFLVSTGTGWLCLEQVRPEGRPTMPGPDFLRGLRLQATCRLGEPDPTRE